MTKKRGHNSFSFPVPADSEGGREMQGEEKESIVSYPWTQAVGRGLYLEVSGCPVEGTLSGFGGRDQGNSL